MKASGIYLIPEYIDIDHIDDEVYVEKGSKYPQDLKDQLKIIREEHCRYLVKHASAIYKVVALVSTCNFSSQQILITFHNFIKSKMT